jgi:multidrug resistance efflux pump
VSHRHWHRGELHRVRGKLLLRLDPADEHRAEESFRRAIETARAQGKRVEAHNLLAAIYGWLAEGFDAPVLKEAKALLDELA